MITSMIRMSGVLLIIEIGGYNDSNGNTNNSHGGMHVFLDSRRVPHGDSVGTPMECPWGYLSGLHASIHGSPVGTHGSIHMSTHGESMVMH
jgi:hypothetical protein